ncbi:MAG: DNA mismatch repair protein MutS [archaeon GW2011_AR17]|nr:MAG: DNA mismatch repair protein MutS [archaeon GW2011_AR17]MBS3154286.1 DNA mismatch repair protein MutS [Candidatus Woesearchaeota archaeon]HIH14834.1 DNA mismatch repair protein MutS [Nanoarchaeota archaeon]HIH58907.1 DNA mismatch repair protein MutS [Nanoarchaeota archaeon]HII14003.1 DNA mismatch repair protein MutS [Nanoarchaeota archaeon]
MDPENLTPAMKQYVELKKEYPDCVIMFRMGDFYEMFYEDAVLASKELEITLTSRGKYEKKAPLAGIPYHALEPYLIKFVKRGYKIAICEQLEDPKKAKGLVKRGIVRIVTPGTLLEQQSQHNSFIMSLYVYGDTLYSAFCDVSTGEFFVSEGVDFAVVDECVIPSSLFVNKELIAQLQSKGLYLSQVEDRFFSQDHSYKTLLDHFHILSLESFGMRKDDMRVRAAGALLSYLLDTQMHSLSHIKKISLREKHTQMFLDPVTIRNLELFSNVRDSSPKGSLISVLDQTQTAMGSRLLRKWLLEPLLELEKIHLRQTRTEYLVQHLMQRVELKNILKHIGDIERIIAKINLDRANARDLVALKQSLILVQQIRLESFGDLVAFQGFQEVIDFLDKALRDDAPAGLKDGGLIRLEFDETLQELHSIRKNSKQFLSALEVKERERTGIKNLKIGYNRVFGYYFEVSAGNLAHIPGDFIRKQTLANYERFVTEDLKREEEKILTAQEKIGELEYELFLRVVEEVKKYTEPIQAVSQKVAEIDVLCSFAQVSVENNYVKPLLDTSSVLEIQDGRHPVVELSCAYIPNDTLLKDFEIMIITGPNFAGKSCYMKQVALLVIMAQMGCFIPAKSARIGLVDRVFTRIGAYDDLVSGQSTFMVEMNETANILNNATSQSLIILDEIGRGTSTYDGVSIAWAVVEYLYNRVKAKTLFATHYHVLNKLTNSFERIKNYNIAVKEEKDEIIFLRKLLEGGTDKSFGVYVAKLAGLPEEVVVRAREVQSELEDTDKLDRIQAKKLEEQKRLF